MSAYLTDVPIGLLIGKNCAKVFQPSKVLPAIGDGTFAALYPHGWTINGPLHINYKEYGSSVVSCNCNNLDDIQFTETFTPRNILSMFEPDVKSSWETWTIL